MTFLNSIQSYFNSVYQRSENLTFSQQITRVKTEVERSPITILELKRQLDDLIPYLENASSEDIKEAFRVLNQVKHKMQIISENDREKYLKDLERKLFQIDLIPEAGEGSSEASERILKTLDDMEEVLKLLDQVKPKIPFSKNDWKKNFKDLERKFIQADLITWGKIPETRGKICEASKRILRVFDGNLISLDMKDLELNSLPESIKQLSQVLHLHVSGNHLTSLPEPLGQLSQLQWLNLNNNRIQSLPEFFRLLSQLQILDLESNNLEFLSESFGQLSQLERLHLSNNQLQSLPESFGLLSRLKWVHLNNNQLRSLPESFGQLSQLQTLTLSHNQLESLPMSIAHCRKSISYINLEGNMNLKKLPPSFEFLYLIREISINKTSINPEEVATLRAKWAAANGVDAIQLLQIR